MTGSDTTCASPCLLLYYILHTSFRQTSQYHTIFSAPILLSRQVFLVTCRCMDWIGSSHTPSISSSHSCFAAHFFQYTIWACFRSIFFHVLRADHSHVHRHLLLKQDGVPMWLVDAQVTGLAHDSSCKSSHLSLCLNLKNLTRHLPPEQAWPWWIVPARLSIYLPPRTHKATPMPSCLLQLPSAPSI